MQYDHQQDVAHLGWKIIAWSLCGILTAAVILMLLGPHACQAQSVTRDGWRATITQPAITRAAPWPRTYELRELPPVGAGHNITILNRDHFAAVLAWSLARQAAREDMARRHRAGIVHPDEL